MDNVIYTEWLAMNTEHSIGRAKERAGMNRKKAEKMMQLARERGITYKDCGWSLDRKFLQFRTDDQVTALAYNGFCFIFDRTTGNCITMYRLPKYFGKKKTFYKNGGMSEIHQYQHACGY